MICSQCGNDVAAGSAACPNCGAQLAGNAAQPAAAPAGAYAGGPAAPAATSPVFAFDAKRLSRDHRIVGGATLVLLISLFLPWYTASAPSTTINGVTVGGGGSISANAFDGHGWVWIVFIVGLAVLAYLVMQAGFETAPVRLPFSPGQILLGLTGLNLLLVLIAFLVKPGTGDTLIKISIGWGIGAFLGLICAIVAFAPLGLPFVRAQRSKL